MSIIEFISQLRNLEIKLWIEGEGLRYQAPKGAMTKELLSQISQRKNEIITFLNQINAEARINSDPILPAPREGQTLPVSFSQQSLWFFDQLTPNNPVYNIPNAVRIKGQLDVKAMESAINEVVNRHEALRTTFKSVDGKPIQVIAPTAHIILEVKLIEREEMLQSVLKDEAWRPFNLEKGPIWRVTLFKLNENEHVLCFIIHHIISDAWSNGIFVREFLSLYEAFRMGKSITLPPLPVQFGDYAYWQRQRFARNEVIEPLLNYWKKQLAEPTILELPTDHHRPLAQSFSGSTKTILLPKDLSEKLKTVCLNEDVTIFMLLMAAFKTLLYRYSSQEDIIVGTVVANRNQIEISGLMGFIMNTLALRTNFSENPTFKEILRRVKTMTLDAYSHQEMPFDMLLEELKLERDLSRTPLFQVMYIHQNTGDVELKASGLHIEVEILENSAAPFDLRMITEECNEGIMCRLDYSTALYEERTIICMLEHYRNLLTGAAEDTSLKVWEMPLLSKDELKQIVVDFNNTTAPYSKDKLIHELFEEVLEKSPNSIALVFEGGQLTYGELNFKANQLAHYLKKLGVGADVTVGICLERSFDMVISILGILKAGGAYVPFDPTYPKDRVEYMINNAKVKVLITWERLLDKIPDGDSIILCLDKEGETIAKENTENLKREVTDHNLAYVIYTSGSTGTPKGAMNTHLGIRNHKLWMQDVYKLTREDRVLQKTPFSFDVSVWEFFWTLINGACLVIAKPEGHKDPEYLVKTIIEQGITVIHFVPSMLYAFLEQPDVNRCTSLRQVVVSGEALNIDLQHRFYKHFNVPMHNVYGPAECADVSTAWTCDNNYHERMVPIGKPISNVKVYILDKYSNPVPVGVVGELCVGGVSVGRGYINNPELTAERFIPDPFSSEPGAKMYKTGDLVRYRHDGNIEYFGRLDFQVKIRGLRIELGEIEEVLDEHPDVYESAVIAWEKEKANKHLVGYVVPKHGKTIEPVALHDFLEDKLPEYMIPRIFVFLESMPLNPSGKLDRKALPEPEMSNIVRTKEYVAPRNEVEKILVDIWKDVIGIDNIGVNDNFFEIGGHSLLLVQVHSKMKEVFKREFSLIDMFSHSTISALAAFVTGTQEQLAFLKNEDRLQKQKEAKLKRKQMHKRGE